MREDRSRVPRIDPQGPVARAGAVEFGGGVDCIREHGGRRRAHRCLGRASWCISRRDEIILSIYGITPASAFNECGTGSTVTCTSTGNPYSAGTGGITYTNPTQTVSLASGVAVNTASIGIWLQGDGGAQTLNLAPGVTVSTTGGNDAILIANSAFGTPAGPVTVNAAGTTVSALGATAYGWDLYASALTATVGDVSVGGGDGGVGVWAQSSGGAVSVTTEDVTTAGSNTLVPFRLPVHGVYAQGTSVAINTTAGTVSMTGANVSVAVYGISSGTINIQTANVSVSGNNSGGSFLPVNGVNGTTTGVGANGAVTINTSAGAVSLTGTTTSHGISAAQRHRGGGGRRRDRHNHRRGVDRRCRRQCHQRLDHRRGGERSSDHQHYRRPHRHGRSGRARHLGVQHGGGE